MIIFLFIFDGFFFQLLNVCVQFPWNSSEAFLLFLIRQRRKSQASANVMLGKQFWRQSDCRNLSRKEGMFSFHSLRVIHVSLSRHNLCCFRVAYKKIHFSRERLKPFSVSPFVRARMFIGLVDGTSFREWN